MKKTKVIALILIVCLLFTVTGCTRPVTPEERENIGVGQVTDGLYENEFYGIAFRTPEDWTCMTQEEIWDLNGWDTDEELQEQLEDRMADYGHFTEMLATKGTELTAKVSVDNAAVMQDPDISEELYARATRIDAEGTLGEAGCENILVQDVYEPFMGSSHYGFHIAAEFNGTMMYQKEMYIKNGIYFLVVTVSSAGEDLTDELLAMFYQI